MSEPASLGHEETGLRTLPPGRNDPDTSHAVRRLRWFASSFRSEVARLSGETGIALRIDDGRLARAFVGWLRAFKAQRPSAEADLKAFSCFAGGLMLQQLVQQDPLRASAIPANADVPPPAAFWPEGYVYVNYCLGVCAAVLEQEFGAPMPRHPNVADLRVWWSFRENVREDSGLAIGFFELFCGMEPNWTMPTVFSAQLKAPPTPIGVEARPSVIPSPAVDAVL